MSRDANRLDREVVAPASTGYDPTMASK